MSTLTEKIDKQFEYQRTCYATSGDRGDLFVTVEHLAGLIAQQTRQDLRRVRRQVKAELERRVDDGGARRWLDVNGPSLRHDRVDHYYVVVDPDR